MTHIFNDIQLIGTIFAALLGLAFGSFLNVFLTRFPEDESIVAPRSHCRSCDHTLAWWENLPLISWILLRGRCRSCCSWIGLRYPIVEMAVALLWVACWMRFGWPLFSSTANPGEAPQVLTHSLITLLGFALFSWTLVALAALDAEYFWLPDLLSLPGTALGFLFTLQQSSSGGNLLHTARNSLLAILAAAGLILCIRLAYWLVRRQEGMGLGDAKLMAMLAAWLGIRGALESFALAIVAATVFALLWLAVLAVRRNAGEWARMPLPLGTFLCAAALAEIFYPNWLLHW